MDKKCQCPAPYQLFYFPSNDEVRSKWRTLINKKAFDDDKKLFVPYAHTRVCSKHFVDGDRNKLPSLQLGYDLPWTEEVKAWIYDPLLTPPIVVVEEPHHSPLTSAQEFVTPTHHATIPEPMPAGEHSAGSSKPPTLRQLVLKRRAVKRSLQLSDSQESDGASPRKRPVKLPDVDSYLAPMEEVKLSGEEKTTTESELSDFGQGYVAYPTITPQSERSFHGKTIDDLLKTVDRLRQEKLALLNHVDMKEGRHLRNIKKLMSPLSSLNTDRRTSLYTGFPNRGTFDAVFSLIKKHAEKIRYWRGESSAAERSIKLRSKSTRKIAKSKSLIKQAAVRSRKRSLQDVTPKRSLKSALYQKKLTLKEEFLMTLMRIRRGFPEEDLAARFHISTASVSMTLITWIKFLAKEFRCLVFMPTREQVKTNLPDAFRVRHGKVKHIIDCAETFIERPSDPVLQYATWSQYKHANTAKYFVCITPDGFISFISQAYPGRITDKQITTCCGWMDLLEEYDEVLADRGFLIREELLERRVHLRGPVGRRGIDQFSKADLAQIRGVANTRIHVERAISRIKHFKMLSHGVNLKTVPQLDDILLIASAICNLCGPLIAEVTD